MWMCRYVVQSRYLQYGDRGPCPRPVDPSVGRGPGDGGQQEGGGQDQQSGQVISICRYVDIYRDGHVDI